MGGGLNFIDIIFFAMIAAFLVFRLRSVLGRRDGHDGSGYQDPFKHERQQTDDATDDNVIPLPNREDADTDLRDEPATAAADPDDPVNAGLVQIRIADPSFHPNEFTEGAKVAFDMILSAFAAGDTKTLKPLLDTQVYANFEAAIEDRDAKEWTVEDTLVGFKTADIMEAYMDGRTATVTVKFVTEQVNVTRDVEEMVVEGNPNEVITVTDFWTFARDTKSRDPNWTLIATHSPE